MKKILPFTNISVIKLFTAETIRLILENLFKYKRKIPTNTPLPIPDSILPYERFLPASFLNSNLFYGSLISSLSILILKNIIESAQPIQQPIQNERVLPLCVCCPLSSTHSINRYVIFNQKNKTNRSTVHVERGQIGRIVKKLEWNVALVNFSIKAPLRFQKLDTKSIADKSFGEGIVIFE